MATAAAWMDGLVVRWMTSMRRRCPAAIATMAVVGTTMSPALGQTDDELRAMYFRRDFEQIERIARSGDTRAEAWMGLIRQQAGRRAEAVATTIAESLLTLGFPRRWPLMENCCA